MRDREEKTPPLPGSRNIRPDGSYVVGKGQPPESGKFRKDDGRPRGRRAKGTQNLLTDFVEEMEALVKVAVDGKQKRVTRQRSIMMRTAHDASRGDAKARQVVLQLNQQRLANAQDVASRAAESEPLQLEDFSEDEIEQLDRLLHKAAGVPYVAPESNDPLRYCRDPLDARNYYTERTIDGLVYRRCHINDVPDQLIRIENTAYASAALPRKEGCYPGHAEDSS